MLKKLLIWTLCLLTLCACGANEEPPTPAPDKPAEDGPVTPEPSPAPQPDPVTPAPEQPAPDLTQFPLVLADENGLRLTALSWEGSALLLEAVNAGPAEAVIRPLYLVAEDCMALSDFCMTVPAGQTVTAPLELDRAQMAAYGLEAVNRLQLWLTAGDRDNNELFTTQGTKLVRGPDHTRQTAGVRLQLEQRGVALGLLNEAADRPGRFVALPEGETAPILPTLPVWVKNSGADPVLLRSKTVRTDGADRTGLCTAVIMPGTECIAYVEVYDAPAGAFESWALSFTLFDDGLQPIFDTDLYTVVPGGAVTAGPDEPLEDPYVPEPVPQGILLGEKNGAAVTFLSYDHRAGVAEFWVANETRADFVIRSDGAVCNGKSIGGSLRETVPPGGAGRVWLQLDMVGLEAKGITGVRTLKPHLVVEQGGAVLLELKNKTVGLNPPTVYPIELRSNDRSAVTAIANYWTPDLAYVSLRFDNRDSQTHVATLKGAALDGEPLWATFAATEILAGQSSCADLLLPPDLVQKGGRLELQLEVKDLAGNYVMTLRDSQIILPMWK